MSTHLRDQTEAQPQEKAQTATRPAPVIDQLVQAVRRDSRIAPQAYLAETQAPQGGE